jgi:hypothetical protein
MLSGWNYEPEKELAKNNANKNARSRQKHEPFQALYHYAPLWLLAT